MAVKKKKTTRRKVTRRRTKIKVARRRRVTIRRRAPKKKTARKKTTAAGLVARLRKHWETILKDALFQRDKATTRQAHRSAQKRIDAARSHLRKV